MHTVQIQDMYRYHLYTWGIAGGLLGFTVLRVLFDCLVALSILQNDDFQGQFVKHVKYDILLPMQHNLAETDAS